MNQSRNIIKNKQYEENSSIEEIEAIKNRVSVYEPGIIYYQELPVQSPFSINTQMNRAIELCNKFEKCGIIIDLTEATRPDAKTRRVLYNRFEELSNITKHTSFFTKGIILNTALRFLMFGLESKSYSVNNNLEDALKLVKESLND